MWIFVKNEMKKKPDLISMRHKSTSVARRPYHVSQESPPASVKLDPDGPVVAEDAQVVPLVQMNLAGRPDDSHPGTAVKSEQKLF